MSANLRSGAKTFNRKSWQIRCGKLVSADDCPGTHAPDERKRYDYRISACTCHAVCKRQSGY